MALGLEIVPGNDDALLRWNTCARTIMKHDRVRPATEERAAIEAAIERLKGLGLIYQGVLEPPKGKAPGELVTRIGKGAVIRSHTIIYAGNEIGEDPWDEEQGDLES